MLPSPPGTPPTPKDNQNKIKQKRISKMKNKRKKKKNKFLGMVILSVVLDICKGVLTPQHLVVRGLIMLEGFVTTRSY